MPNDDGPDWGSLSAIGFQVLVGVALGFFVGRWLDRKFNTEPWWTLICIALGLASGMYVMIREGIRANRDPRSKK